MEGKATKVNIDVDVDLETLNGYGFGVHFKDRKPNRKTGLSKQAYKKLR